MVPSKNVTCIPYIQLSYRIIYDADHIKNEVWFKKRYFCKAVLQKLTELGWGVPGQSHTDFSELMFITNQLRFWILTVSSKPQACA